MKANELIQDNLLAAHAQYLVDHGYGNLEFDEWLATDCACWSSSTGLTSAITTSSGIDKLTGFFVPPEKEIRQNA